MYIIAPYRINQTIMLTWKRIQTKVVGFQGTILSNGELDDYLIIETEYGRVRLSDIKTAPTKDTYTLKAKYDMGSEVLYHDDNSYANHIMQKGKIDEIEFNVSRYGDTFWYGINGRKMDTHLIYNSISDFKNRTKPKREIKEGERYIFRNYLMQQKYLEPIKVEEYTTTHSKYRGEKIRNCYLYSSIEKFHKRMLAQVK